MDIQSLLGELAKILGGAGFGGAAMRFLFRINKDMEVCHTRFIQKKPGWPWAGQIAVHRNKTGWDMQEVAVSPPKKK